MSPTDAVFTNYELLESILLNLSLQNLAVVQRKQMFLMPISSPLEPVFKDNRAWPPEYEQNLDFHPAFKVSLQKHKRRCKHNHHGQLITYALHKCALADTPTSADAGVRSIRKYPPKRHSILNMFVTNPPVTAVDIVDDSFATSPRNLAARISSVRNPTGVKIGDVCHAAAAALRSHRAATGQGLPSGRFGFLLVDPFAPEPVRARLKGGRRYGGCEMCERAAEKDASAHAVAQGT